MVWYVDADSFPALARGIIQRRAKQKKVDLVFVGRVSIKRQPDEIHHMVITAAMEDSADAFLRATAQAQDLVFTRDIPLARDLLEKGITVLNDRGTVFDMATIRERLSQRDFMADLRALGLAEMAGKSYGEKEKKAFADGLDRCLSRLGL